MEESLTFRRPTIIHNENIVDSKELNVSSQDFRTMMTYFEKLAQDAYSLASKYGPLDEQSKIQEEATKIKLLHSQHSQIAEYLESKKSRKNTTAGHSRSFVSGAAKPSKAMERAHKLYNDAVIKRGNVGKLALEKSRQEAEKTTFKPTIDPNSRKIAGERAPIHERYQEVLQEKEKTVRKLRQTVLQEEIEKHPEDYYYDFKPSLELSQMAVGRSRREFNEFLRDVHEWHEKKKKRAQVMAEEKEEKEKKNQSCQPKINPNTLKIMESKYGNMWPGFLQREDKFVEKVNASKREKLEREMDSFFFPITENRIKELRSRSTFDVNKSHNLTLSNWSPSPIAKGGKSIEGRQRARDNRKV